MKKKIAAFLCGIMCMGTFAGCSADEMAYLKMSHDLSSLLEKSKITGTVQVDVDFDRMHEQVGALASAYYGVEDFMVNENEDLDGKKSFVVDYEMNLDANQMAYDVAFDVKYNGKDYDFGVVSQTVDKGTYMSNDFLLGLYELFNDIDSGEESTFKMSEEYAKEFKEIISKDEYIKLVDTEEITGMDMNSVLSNQDVSDVTGAVTELLQGVLEGFETGMVKSVSNGFEVSATGAEAADMVVRMLNHVADNPVRVIDATEKFVNTSIEKVGKDAAEVVQTQAEMKEVFAAMRADHAVYVDMLKEAAATVEAAVKEENAANMLKNISFKETIVKAGEGYEATGVYALKHEGQDVIAVKTSTKIMKFDAKISVPESYVEMSALEEKLTALEDKYNPVIGAEIDWGFEKGDTEAILYAVRKHYDDSALEWTNVVVEEGRAYVPLRLIAEKLGEEVGWENATKTPYVMKDGQRIDMKGLLQGSTAYVGVRDFEKLGYTVDYTVDEYGVREARIMS